MTPRIAQVKTWLIEGATRSDYIWTKLYQDMNWLGQAGPLLPAISAMDIALRDLAGKRTGLSLTESLKRAAMDRLLAVSRALGPSFPIAVEMARRIADADILMPDVTRRGGISELRKIANLCERYNVPGSPHNPNGPISTIASAHAMAFFTLAMKPGWASTLQQRNWSDIPA